MPEGANKFVIMARYRRQIWALCEKRCEGGVNGRIAPAPCHPRQGAQTLHER